MIVHPGSNNSAVLNFEDAQVGGLSIANYSAPADTVASLSQVPTISPTLVELNGS